MSPRIAATSKSSGGEPLAVREPRTKAFVDSRNSSADPASRPAFTDFDALSPVAVRAFVNIASAWALDEKACLVLLGSPSRTTYYHWKREPDSARLSVDTLERVSYLLGIYKALQILLPEAQAADGWVKRPNAASPFNGRSALEFMLAGQVVDLYRVRSYLDAWRGG